MIRGAKEGLTNATAILSLQQVSSSQCSGEDHIPVILKGRLGTKNTCCKHKMAVAFINPSLAARITVYCSYMYVCLELSKRVLLQTVAAFCNMTLEFTVEHGCSRLAVSSTQLTTFIKASCAGLVFV